VHVENELFVAGVLVTCWGYEERMNRKHPSSGLAATFSPRGEKGRGCRDLGDGVPALAFARWSHPTEEPVNRKHPSFGLVAGFCT
jgi:hypothetical protein